MGAYFIKKNAIVLYAERCGMVLQKNRAFTTLKFMFSSSQLFVYSILVIKIYLTSREMYDF